MAVNINTVYTTVLFILNKEQRGYITPNEFNSLAVQVQDEIFSAYFPDGNQLNRFNQNNQQNDTEFFNMFKDTAYKLYPFEKEAAFTFDTPSQAFYYNGVGEIYKLGEIISTYTGNPTYDSITQLTSKSDFSTITRSKLTTPTSQYPICHTTNAVVTTTPATAARLIIKVSPVPNSLLVNCIFKPTDPQWRFSIGGVGQYVYNQEQSQDFELDISEQTNLITNILKYCGIIINDPTIIQTAAAEAQEVNINEKS